MATAAAGGFAFADVDVFTIPHFRMKHLLVKASKKVESTDFSNSISFSCLLNELMSTFLEIKQHEEIENKYIMKILKRKLQGEALKKLLVHLHAHSHIADILNHVRKTEREFNEGLCTNLKDQGRKLNKVIQHFFEEYVPHMVEEEQVLQPLLMEFLTHSELRQIQIIVLQLHHLKEKNLSSDEFIDRYLKDLHIGEQIKEEELISLTPSINCLPTEIISHIFSYLGPKDLCQCAQVNQSWSELSFTGSLWQTIHPSYWVNGQWIFGDSLTSDDCNCDCSPNYELTTFTDELNEGTIDSSDTSSIISDSEDNLNELMQKELTILNGLNRYVLPKVGGSVKTLVLECSKAITNGLLFRMLSQCSNLEYLDISQTIISDLGLMGLFKVGCRSLQYLDVSGCRNMTDKMLLKLSSALGKKICKCKSKSDNNITLRRLKTLRLSGCYKITDLGLESLSRHGGLPYLKHLDLSGCMNITGEGLQKIVKTSPLLPISELYYCDNIVEETFDIEAGGCQNSGCANRYCCRNYMT